MNKFQRTLLARHRRWNFQRKQTFDVIKESDSSYFMHEGHMVINFWPKRIHFNFYGQINKGLEGVALCFGCKSLSRTLRVIEKYMERNAEAVEDDNDWFFGYERLTPLLHAVEDSIEMRNIRDKARSLHVEILPTDDIPSACMKIGRAMGEDAERQTEAFIIAHDLARTNNSSETARRQLCALGIVA